MGVAWFSTHWLGLLAPEANLQRAIGARGPITLIFQQPMQPESVELHFSLAPQVDGKFTWDAAYKSLSFWPAQPLLTNMTYRLHLQAGAKTQNGLGLPKDATWTVTVRTPEVLFLSPSQAPELWKVPSTGDAPQQLTQTGGRVFDYSVSPDGAQIIFSARNAQQGLDLWTVDREGKAAQQLLPCGPDWCFSPAVAPDGVQVAYSRRQVSGIPGAGPGAPRLWILNLNDRSTEALYLDPSVSGSDPLWSPDGHWLGFVDDTQVRIINIAAKTDFSLPTGAGAALAWSPDSRYLLYTYTESTGEQPYQVVNRVNVQTQQSEQVLGSSGEDYSIPDLSPDGAWLVVAWRALDGGPGRQLYLLHSDGSQPEAITEDALSLHARYHWDFQGEKLVFQRLRLGGSDERPAVLVWDRSSKQTLPLAEDAFQPQWLP